MIPSNRIRKIHFIGIGGAGMSGIAEILHRSQFIITGSDPIGSPVVQNMKNLGIKIQDSHLAENVHEADLVVYSSAIKENNAERMECERLATPCIRRAEMLGELMRLKYTLAISGTHGKTTTTSILGHLWLTAQRDPTLIIGGVVRNLGTGARHGSDGTLIAEADEYDRSFLEMVPSSVILTNVEADHLDCYKDLEEIKEAFIQFCNKVPFYGLLVACIDDAGVRSILGKIKKPIMTYGFFRQADYRIENLEMAQGKAKWNLIYKNNNLGPFELPLAGQHNVLNAVGATALALQEGISITDIQKGLSTFGGVKRRMEHHGTYNSIELYDDYAHHPTEVEATLTGIRENYPQSRIIVLFQPHLFSRTQDLYQKFASALLGSDKCLLLPIYGAREEPIDGVNSELIVHSAREQGHSQINTLSEESEIIEWVKANTQQNDIVLTMGAGPVWKLITTIGDIL
jgi:UDP-N-acetylmuramate--alanine ligase